MMASWQQWLAKGDVKTHQTSKQEVDNLRALIARDLADAAISGLSADRRFATAYNAALQTGTIAIACSGYRVGRTKCVLSEMPPLLLQLWREQHPAGHEQVMIDFSIWEKPAEPVALFPEEKQA